MWNERPSTKSNKVNDDCWTAIQLDSFWSSVFFSFVWLSFVCFTFNWLVRKLEMKWSLSHRTRVWCRQVDAPFEWCVWHWKSNVEQVPSLSCFRADKKKWKVVWQTKWCECPVCKDSRYFCRDSLPTEHETSFESGRSVGQKVTPIEKAFEEAAQRRRADFGRSIWIYTTNSE